jgi:hypothetical protein
LAKLVHGQFLFGVPLHMNKRGSSSRPQTGGQTLARKPQLREQAGNCLEGVELNYRTIARPHIRVTEDRVVSPRDNNNTP